MQIGEKILWGRREAWTSGLWVKSLAFSRQWEGRQYGHSLVSKEEMVPGRKPQGLSRIRSLQVCSFAVQVFCSALKQRKREFPLFSASEVLVCLQVHCFLCTSQSCVKCILWILCVNYCIILVIDFSLVFLFYLNKTMICIKLMWTKIMYECMCTRRCVCVLCTLFRVFHIISCFISSYHLGWL